MFRMIVAYDRCIRSIARCDSFINCHMLNLSNLIDVKNTLRVYLIRNKISSYDIAIRLKGGAYYVVIVTIFVVPFAKW